jgi:hypothetical protein
MRTGQASGRRCLAGRADYGRLFPRPTTGGFRRQQRVEAFVGQCLNYLHMSASTGPVNVPKSEEDFTPGRQMLLRLGR